MQNTKALLVDPATFRRVKTYAKETGVSVQKGTCEALNDWLDTVGKARIEYMQGKINLSEPAPPCADAPVIASTSAARGKLLQFARS